MDWLRTSTKLLSRQTICILSHVLVILGLTAALPLSVIAHRIAVRAIETGEESDPIPYTDVNPLGVNTFLQAEPDSAKVAQMLDMIAAAGFTYIRQPFFWYEIEPRPGVYWDARWGVDTWAKYDRIVRLATERGIEIIARLDKPPRWAREGQPYLDECPDGPPTRYEDYARFVATVVARYRGQIRYIQIWNEPNLRNEWGCQPIDPTAFTHLLALAYQAAKEVDPNIVVLMPGLAPTDQTGPENLSELLFLEGMYRAGAAPYFDIASAMVYGYGYSPYDRRVDFARNNFSRVIQLREIMERYGDAQKPIWVVEYNWVAFPPDWRGLPSVWGKPVSLEEQARYLYQGYLRAQREWPWVGVMCVWYFRWWLPPDDPENWPDPSRGFAIVEWDFTPRPAYHTLTQARPILDRAWTGTYEPTSRYWQSDGGWVLETTPSGHGWRAREPGAILTFSFGGPELRLTLLPGTQIAVRVDDYPEKVLTVNSTAPQQITVATHLSDGPHTLQIRAGTSDGGILRAQVIRRPLVLTLLPWILASIVIVLALNSFSLFMLLGGRQQISQIRRWADRLGSRRSKTAFERVTPVGQNNPASRSRQAD